MNEVKVHAMAYVHRSSTTIPRVSIWWIADTPAADQKKLLDWMKGVYELLKADAQSESFQNFPNPLVTDWKTAYYGRNLPKLVDLKKRFDPQNLFQHSQSIPLTL